MYKIAINAGSINKIPMDLSPIVFMQWTYNVGTHKMDTLYVLFTAISMILYDILYE